jgi:hypothetical protein
VKAIPEPNETVLTADVEHLCGEPLPPVLKPHVVQRAHRIIRTRVVGLQLLERAVPLGAHPRGKLSTSRSHGWEHLERLQTRRQPGCDERVQGEVDEDLAEPEGRQPQISEDLEGVAELMNRDEVGERRQRSRSSSHHRAGEHLTLAVEKVGSVAGSRPAAIA